jgi:hypothetical protein
MWLQYRFEQFATLDWQIDCPCFSEGSWLSTLSVVRAVARTPRTPTKNAAPCAFAPASPAHPNQIVSVKQISQPSGLNFSATLTKYIE